MTLISSWKKCPKNAIIFVGKVGRNELSMKDVFMDTAKLMSKGQVTIPKRMRDLLNLENGDYDRGKNQEKVIEAVIKKIANIRKYN